MVRPGRVEAATRCAPRLLDCDDLDVEVAGSVHTGEAFNDVVEVPLPDLDDEIRLGVPDRCAVDLREHGVVQVDQQVRIVGVGSELEVRDAVGLVGLDGQGSHLPMLASDCSPTSSDTPPAN